MHKEQLIGTWQLISCKNQTEDGLIKHSFGPDPLGLLMYDALGNMSAQLMRAHRPRFRSDDFLEGTPEEIQSAFNEMVCYFGMYKVDEENESVIHYVKGASIPNLEGQQLRRSFKFERDCLILSVPPMKLGKQIVTEILVWQRLA